jgi:hypothetical protein
MSDFHRQSEFETIVNGLYETFEKRQCQYFVRIPSNRFSTMPAKKFWPSLSVNSKKKM